MQTVLDPLPEVYGWISIAADGRIGMLFGLSSDGKATPLLAPDKAWAETYRPIAEQASRERGGHRIQLARWVQRDVVEELPLAGVARN